MSLTELTLFQQALYEKAPESAKATPEQIQRHLFPKPEENNGQPYASCLVAKLGDKPGEGEAVGIALVCAFFVGLSVIGSSVHSIGSVPIVLLQL